MRMKGTTRFQQNSTVKAEPNIRHTFSKSAKVLDQIPQDSVRLFTHYARKTNISKKNLIIANETIMLLCQACV
jgi:uncharacterized membrane-anchored protein YhcB (DUF1043 family)